MPSTGRGFDETDPSKPPEFPRQESSASVPGTPHTPETPKSDGATRVRRKSVSSKQGSPTTPKTPLKRTGSMKSSTLSMRGRMKNSATSQMFDMMKETEDLKESTKKTHLHTAALRHEQMAMDGKRQILEKTLIQKRTENAEELAALAEQIAALKHATKQELGKSEGISKVEEYIFSMYMEFMVLPPDMDPTSDAMKTLKHKIRTKLRTSGPVPMLADLRTELRAIATEQTREQQALQTELDLINARRQEATSAFSKERNQLMAAKRNSNEKQAATDTMNDDWSIQDLVAEWEPKIQQTQAQIKETKAMIQRKDKEIEMFTERIGRRDDILMAKETDLVRRHLLEQQLERDKRRHQLEINNLRAQSFKQKSQLAKESQMFFKSNEERKNQMAELEQVKQEIADSRALMNSDHIQEVKQKLNEAQAKEAEKRAERKIIMDAIKALERSSEDLQFQNRVMKEEYTRLFKVVETAQRKRQEHQRLRSQLNASMARTQEDKDEAAHYQQKYDQRSAEAIQLTKKYKNFTVQKFKKSKICESEYTEVMDDLMDVKKQASQEEALQLRITRGRSAGPGPRTRSTLSHATDTSRSAASTPNKRPDRPSTAAATSKSQSRKGPTIFLSPNHRDTSPRNSAQSRSPAHGHARPSSPSSAEQPVTPSPLESTGLTPNDTHVNPSPLTDLGSSISLFSPPNSAVTTPRLDPLELDEAPMPNQPMTSVQAITPSTPRVGSASTRASEIASSPPRVGSASTRTSEIASSTPRVGSASTRTSEIASSPPRVGSASTRTSEITPSTPRVGSASTRTSQATQAISIAPSIATTAPESPSAMETPNTTRNETPTPTPERDTTPSIPSAMGSPGGATDNVLSFITEGVGASSPKSQVSTQATHTGCVRLSTLRKKKQSINIGGSRNGFVPAGLARIPLHKG